MIDSVGYVAASLTTASFLPQVLKTIKTRDTAGISFAMYILYAKGVFLWLVYGALIHNPTMRISNAITLSLAGMVLWIKIKNYSKLVSH